MDILYYLNLVVRKGKCEELIFLRCFSGLNVSIEVGVSC